MFGITAFAQSPFAALGGNVYNAAISESLAVDAVVDGIALNIGYIDETVSVGSTITATVTFNQDVVEAAAVTDSISAAGSIYNVLVAESAVIDAFQNFAGAELTASITESVVAADGLSVQFIGYVDIAESVSVSDEQISQRALNAALTESAAAADSQAANLVLTGSVNESAAVADNITYTVNAKATPTGILLTISLANVNVWGDINDDADPNWVEIND
jgi:hypothetical protein